MESRTYSKRPNEQSAGMAAQSGGAPGGVTIHKRPKRGSLPCWGRCGRRVSANASHCLSCKQALEAAATSHPSQSSAPSAAPDQDGAKVLAGVDAPAEKAY